VLTVSELANEEFIYICYCVRPSTTRSAQSRKMTITDWCVVKKNWHT